MTRNRDGLRRREFLGRAALGAAGAAASVAAGCAAGRTGHATDRPNLLFIFADQMRGMDMACAGNGQVRTPHLDRLAAEGTQFTHAYANTPVCTPCRGTILTGRYPHAHRAVANDLALPDDEVTVAELLRDAGYRTGYIGKWHLDGVPRDGFTPPGPRRQGFDFWAAWNCAHAYFNGRVYRDTPEAVRLRGYEPVGQTDLAMKFLAADDARPWCLYLSWGPPHAPYEQVPETYKAMYDAAQITPRPNVWDAPPAGFKRPGPGPSRETLAHYYAHISAIDEQVGRLLDALRRRGQAASTLVVFTSDHGDMLWSQGTIKKEQPWEESIRIPLLVRWPRRAPAGRTSDALVSAVDLAPTLLALMGCPVPDRMQGEDLSAVALGRADEGPDAVLLTEPVIVDQGLAQGIREWRGLRTARYTYARWWDGGGWVLYDNQEDPYQLRNLIDSPGHALLRAELEKRLRARLAAVGDECRSWQDTIRSLGLVESWNRRERVMHPKAPRLLETA